jgi:hypothetical protein
VTKREGATPFDATRLPDVRLNHRGDRCTLEAILEDFKLAHPALQRMIRSFVRPTSRVRNMLRQRELAPGAIAQGFRRRSVSRTRNDSAVHDALYAYAGQPRNETVVAAT